MPFSGPLKQPSSGNHEHSPLHQGLIYGIEVIIEKSKSVKRRRIIIRDVSEKTFVEPSGRPTTSMPHHPFYLLISLLCQQLQCVLEDLQIVNYMVRMSWGKMIYETADVH